MAFSGLLITEIFYSLQGETSHVGLPYVFVRLTGCNLRCTYCDTTYAFKGGKKMSFEEALNEIQKYSTPYVLLTGGEPLLQRNTLDFIRLLNQHNYKVSIETHGELSIEEASKVARLVVDCKTPASGMNRGGFEKNLKFIKPTDEVKFVIASKEDYEFAKNWVLSKRIPTQEILFSPVMPAQNQPGTCEGVEPTWLAEKILADQLPVRFQLQLHKQLWGLKRGV